MSLTESADDRALSLIYYGELGHVTDWPAWAAEVRLVRGELAARADRFAMGMLYSGDDCDRWTLAGMLRDLQAAIARLDDAYAARDSKAWAWPTWAGADHELARF